jgi:hypothetical protein
LGEALVLLVNRAKGPSGLAVRTGNADNVAVVSRIVVVVVAPAVEVTLLKIQLVGLAAATAVVATTLVVSVETISQTVVVVD